MSKGSARATVAFVVCVSMIAGGIVFIANESEAQGEPRVLVVGMLQDVPDFNIWNLASNSVWKSDVLGWGIEGLVSLDYDMLPCPALAESWTFDEPTLTWTFHLRHGVKFHDGTGMTADDVVFIYKAAREGNVYSANIISAFDSNNDGAASQAEMDAAIVKVDSYTVQMTMGSSYGLFLSTTATTPILPKAIWENHLNVGGLIDVLWNDEMATTGTGPFRYAGGVPDDHRVIEAFVDYWGRNLSTPLGYRLYPAGIDQVYFRTFSSLNDAILALQSGAVDHLPWAITSGWIPRLQADPDISLQYLSDNGYFYLAFNEKFDPMGSLAFRKAVSHVIDKDQIVNVYMGGLGVKGDACEPPFWGGAWYNASVEKYPYDSDYSTPNAILDASGFIDANGDGWRDLPDGTPMQKITILTPPADYDPVRINAGLMIAKNMRDGLHINAEAKAIDFDTLVTRLQSMDYQMLIIGWSLASDPVGNVFDIVGPRASSNTFGFWSEANPNPFYKDLWGVVTRADAETQMLADQVVGLEGLAKSSFDVVDQMMYTRWAEGDVADAVPVNVLYYRVNALAHSSSWTGWYPFMGGLLNRFSLAYVADTGEPVGLREANANLNAALTLPDKVGIGRPAGAYVTAVDSSGRPVSGASVSISISGYSGPATIVAAPDSGTTNQSGVFSFDLDGLVRGNSNITATVSKGVDVSIAVATVESVGDKEATLVLEVRADATVLRPGESTIVRVNVTDEYLAPVEGASVSVDPNLISYGSVDTPVVVTDINGEATMTYTAPGHIDQLNSHLTLSLQYSVSKTGYSWTGSATVNLAIFNELSPDWVIAQVDSVGTTALSVVSNSTTISVSAVDDEGSPLAQHRLWITYSNSSQVFDPVEWVVTDDFGSASFDVQIQDSPDSSALRVTVMNRTVLNAVPATVTLTYSGSGTVPRMYGGYMTWDTHYLDPQVDWIEATAYVWDETGTPADGVGASLVVSGTPYGSLVWNDFIFWDSTYDGWGINIITSADGANLVTSGPFTTYFDYDDWDQWYNAGYIYWDYADNVMVPVDITAGSVTIGIYTQDWAPLDLLGQVYLVPDGVGTFNGDTLSYQIDGPTTISGDYVIGRAYAFAEPYLYISDPVLEARVASYDSTGLIIYTYDENNAPLPFALSGVYQNSLRGNLDYEVQPGIWRTSDIFGGSGRVIVAVGRSGAVTSASIQADVYGKAVYPYAVSMITQTRIFIQTQQCFVELDPVIGTPTIGDTLQVSATVLDFLGNPVEGLTVEIIAEAGDVAAATAVSGPDGRASFTIETNNITSSPVGYIPVKITAGGPAYDIGSARMMIPIREGVPPVADAGNDATVTEGDLVMFDGLGSTDNFAVVNYTWTFTYDGSTRTLYGMTPSFVFLIAGTYPVTLNVTDQAGNYNTDTVVITVEVLIPEFPALLLPVCGVLAAAAIISWQRRNRRD